MSVGSCTVTMGHVHNLVTSEASGPAQSARALVGPDCSTAGNQPELGRLRSSLLLGCCVLVYNHRVWQISIWVLPWSYWSMVGSRPRTVCRALQHLPLKVWVLLRARWKVWGFAAGTARLVTVVACLEEWGSAIATAGCARYCFGAQYVCPMQISVWQMLSANAPIESCEALGSTFADKQEADPESCSLC